MRMITPVFTVTPERGAEFRRFVPINDKLVDFAVLTQFSSNFASLPCIHSLVTGFKADSRRISSSGDLTLKLRNGPFLDSSFRDD